MVQWNNVIEELGNLYYRPPTPGGLKSRDRYPLPDTQFTIITNLHRLTASSTGHYCNKGIIPSSIGPNSVQLILKPWLWTDSLKLWTYIDLPHQVRGHYCNKGIIPSSIGPNSVQVILKPWLWGYYHPQSTNSLFWWLFTKFALPVAASHGNFKIWGHYPLSHSKGSPSSFFVRVHDSNAAVIHLLNYMAGDRDRSLESNYQK